MKICHVKARHKRPRYRILLTRLSRIGKSRDGLWLSGAGGRRRSNCQWKVSFWGDEIPHNGKAEGVSRGTQAAGPGLPGASVSPEASVPLGVSSPGAQRSGRSSVHTSARSAASSLQPSPALCSRVGRGRDLLPWGRQGTAKDLPGGCSAQSLSRPPLLCLSPTPQAPMVGSSTPSAPSAQMPHTSAYAPPSKVAQILHLLLPASLCPSGRYFHFSHFMVLFSFKGKEMTSMIYLFNLH